MSALPAHDADGTDDSSSNSEIEMKSLNPPPFRSTTAEDAETWLCKFNNFCQYKEYGEDKAKAFFKVLLMESATVWLESVNVATVGNWTTLQQAFKARYMRASFLKYKHASELFNKKQNSETVHDFCAQMQHLAKQVSVDDQML